MQVGSLSWQGCAKSLAWSASKKSARCDGLSGIICEQPTPYLQEACFGRSCVLGQSSAALPRRGYSIHADRRRFCWRATWPLLRCLTFELRRDRRRDARPGGWMISEAGRRAWWLAVGPRLERGVRQRHARCAPVESVPRPLALLLACHSCLPLRAGDGCAARLQAARHGIG